MPQRFVQIFALNQKFSHQLHFQRLRQTDGSYPLDPRQRDCGPSGTSHRIAPRNIPENARIVISVIFLTRNNASPHPICISRQLRCCSTFKQLQGKCESAYLCRDASMCLEQAIEEGAAYITRTMAASLATKYRIALMEWKFFHPVVALRLISHFPNIIRQSAPSPWLGVNATNDMNETAISSVKVLP